MSIILTVGSNTVELTTYVPGSKGDVGNIFTLPTEITIGNNRALASVGEYVIYADSSLGFQVIGISTKSAISGSDVSIQNSGKMTVAGAGWIANKDVYLSTIGTLTQTPPTTGLVQKVGLAHDAETLIIKIANITIDGGNYE